MGKSPALREGIPAITAGNYSDASGKATAKSFTDVGTPSPRKLFGAGEAATNILE